jgi:hypothetical protein
VSFGGVALADILIQRGDQFRSLFEEGVEGAAGADGIQLAVVTDQDEFRSGSLHAEGETAEVTVVGHPRFVHDHHRP